MLRVENEQSPARQVKGSFVIGSPPDIFDSRAQDSPSLTQTAPSLAVCSPTLMKQSPISTEESPLMAHRLCSHDGEDETDDGFVDLDELEVSVIQ